MLYLAQVVIKDLEGTAKLQLLASQKAEHNWVKMVEEAYIFSEGDIPFNEGAMVLIQLSSTQKVQSIENARDWILDSLEQYLVAGISPAQLQEEAERAEQWRQSLTLQSQELARRALEMEARQDQIQQLEENLKREKKQLEIWAAELKPNTEKLEHNLNTPS